MQGMLIGIAIFTVGFTVNVATNTLYALPLCFVGGIIFGYWLTESSRG
jgi:hypothetical protein